METSQYMSRGALDRGNVKIERLDPRLKTGNTTFLFNIYRREFTQNIGTCGIYYIPGCPEGREYVKSPSSIPGTVEDIYPHFQDGEEYRCTPTPGEDVVRAVLATDRPEEDLTRFGVFASINEVPTKQELAAAKAKLVPFLQKQIALADRLYASADAGDRQSVYDIRFFDAARYLNVKKPWLSEAAEMTLCPFCSSAVRPEAPKCGNCHEIINVPAYEALKAKIAAGAK